MTSHIGTIVSSVIIFLATLSINFFIDSLFASNGEYKQAVLAPQSANAMAALTISNYSDKELSDVKLLVPAGLTISEIKSSLPVTLTLKKGSVSDPLYQLLNVSLLPANKSISLLIPMHSIDSCCELLNAGLLGIEEVDSQEAKNPMMETLITGLMLAVTCTIVYLLFVAYVRMKFNEYTDKTQKAGEDHIREVETRLEKSKEERKAELEPLKIFVREAQEELENKKLQLLEMESKLGEYEKAYGRFKATYLQKLADHQKELNFWKDTIRKVLYQAGSGLDVTNALFNSVTSALETYHTKKDVTFEVEIIKGLYHTVTDIHDIDK